jgi:hypothetical protein
VLAELGYSATEIDDLHAAGVVGVATAHSEEQT